MSRSARFSPIYLLCALLLGACNYPPAVYSRTEAPIYIPPTPAPATPIPTPTPDPVQLGAEVVVPKGLFAFQPVTSLDSTSQPLTLIQETSRASLYSTDGNLYFNFSGEPAGSSQTAQDCLDALILRMSPDLQSMQAEAGEEVQADGHSGIRERISGLLLGQPVWMDVSAFRPADNCFLLIGIATGEQPQTLWEAAGQPALQKMLETIRFLDPAAIPVCETAADPNYGFSADAPIKVGNINLYDGRSREETYLATLRGPQGQEIFFTRQEPLYNAAGVIVDPYEVNYDGIEQPRLLYFDIYSFETLLVPQSFSCEAPFPLYAP